MTSSTPARRPLARSQKTALALLALGVLLAAVIGTQFDGFVGGLIQGAGIGLILVGTFVLSPFLRRAFRTRKGKDSTDTAWLPSQDGDR